MFLTYAQYSLIVMMEIGKAQDGRIKVEKTIAGGKGIISVLKHSVQEILGR